jgi:CHASE2 domain-containing sensor protein
MWGWSILSAVGIQMSHRLKQFLMLLGIVGGTLIFIGWIALIKGLWLPLVPALLAVAITGGAIGTQKLRNPQEKTRSLRWIE